MGIGSIERDITGDTSGTRCFGFYWKGFDSSSERYRMGVGGFGAGVRIREGWRGMVDQGINSWWLQIYIANFGHELGWSDI